MDLRASLVKARGLLTPTGEIAVVGCCANKTVRDWVWSAMCVPAARIGSWLHSETRNIGVVVTDPQEGLDDIRRTVDEVLPGASVRRALYYRYLLRWRSGLDHLGSFDSILSATSAACVTAASCCGLHAWMSRIRLATSERTCWHDLVWSPAPRVYGIASRLSVLVSSPLCHAGNAWPLS